MASAHKHPRHVADHASRRHHALLGALLCLGLATVLAMILDLKKAYNCIKTGDFEKMLRLQVWRWCKEDAEWETFGFTCMTFGDIGASLILEIGKQMAAEAGKVQFQELESIGEEIEKQMQGICPQKILITIPKVKILKKPKKPMMSQIS